MKKRPLIIITRGYPVNEEELSFLPPELAVLEEKFEISLLPKYSGEKCSAYLSDRYPVKECPYQPSVAKFLKWGLLSVLDIRLWKEIFLSLNRKKKEKNSIHLKALLADCLTAMMLSKNLDNVLKPMLDGYGPQDEVLIYSYWFDYSLLSATSAYAKRKNVRVITRAHGFDLYNERCSSGSQVYKEQMDKLVDKVVFISEYGMKYYLEHFAVSDRNKYLLSYIGTPKQKLAPYQKQEYFQLVSCSYMVPLKRLDIIIQALSRINSHRIHWVHLGDGPTREAMERMAAEKLARKENISYEFKGYMENSRVLDYYARNNIGCYILISDTEGLPFAIMEAMSFGIPVIANDVGGVREIVTAANGILLPQIDVQMTAEAISTMAALADGSAMAEGTDAPDNAAMDVQSMEKMRKQAFMDWQAKFNGAENAGRLAEALNQLYT